MTANAGPRTLVLVSGGIESTVLLHRAWSQGEAPLAVLLDYGQRAAAMEREAAASQCRSLGLKLEVLDMSGVASVFHSGQDRHFHVPLPHRNLVALSLGLSLADKRGADRLLLGLNREDGTESASAGPGLMDDFGRLAERLGSVRVEAPLIGSTKAEIVAEGRELGVDFSGTYSCLLGYSRPCGKCPQCRKRRAAFAGAGLPEPQCALSLPEV